MISKKELVQYLEKEFPNKNAENWDFVGFSLKSSKKYISKILVVLDVNRIVVDEAIKKNVDFIISFHPFRFANNWKSIYQYDIFKSELVSLLKIAKIAVYSIHTNFDLHSNGTKKWIIKKILLKKKNNVKEFKYFFTFNYDSNFYNLVDMLKKNLNLNFLISNCLESDKKIKTVAFWPGSGDLYEMIKELKKAKINIDIIITSDIKWNEQQLLNSEKIYFINISHKIEDVFVEAIPDFLYKQFKEKIDITSLKINDFLKIY